MKEKIFKIDLSKVNLDVLKKLETGEARIINGVARNIKDNSQILQHMPFKEVIYTSNQELSQVIQASQQAVTSMVAISSVAIMGAVIISTAYLSKKLDKIQKQIDNIHKEIQDQNIIYYSEKIANYFGALEATRELINDQKVVIENPDLILLRLSDLSILRNQLTSFIDNIIYISDGFSSAHKALVIDFVNMTMDLLPKGIFVESQAAYKIERFYLGDNIRETAKLKYNNTIKMYKEWANDKYKKIVSGKSDKNVKAFQKSYKEIRSLYESKENELLLKYTA